MHSDTSEKGLETIITDSLVKDSGYVQGDSSDFDREHCVDLARLSDFVKATQPQAWEALSLAEDSVKRTKFLNRLQGEIAKRGVIDVLRLGVSDGPVHVDLYYSLPSDANHKARERYGNNIFSITRQLQYSMTGTRLALDMAIFINGLPVMTFELKNKLTKQTVDDAVRQYKRDRDPRETIFQFGRCMVHFALMTMKLACAPISREMNHGFFPSISDTGTAREIRQILPAWPLIISGNKSSPKAAFPISWRTMHRS